MDIGKGEVVLTLTNIGELPCPQLNVMLSATTLTVTAAVDRTTQIFPSPEPAPGPRTLIRPTPPTANLGEPISWTGSFAIRGPYPAAGFTVTTTLRPVDGTFPTITLPSLVVAAASIGKGR